MRGHRPLPATYPRRLRTLGDHIRKRRLDLGLLQRDVAQQLGANPDTVKNWEMGYTAPALWFIPRIIRFLGYVPFDTTRDSFPLGTRLKEYRRV